MKLTTTFGLIAASTVLASPAAEQNVVADAQPALIERDGPSLTTYAVQGFRISNINAVIKPWSLRTTTVGNSVSFTAQALSPTYQNLGSPFTCTKTWQDSLLESTGNKVVKCSDPNASFFLARNHQATTEIVVNLAYSLPPSSASSSSAAAKAEQYFTDFTLNQSSPQVNCTQNKANAQICVSNGGTLLSSTLSEKDGS